MEEEKTKSLIEEGRKGNVKIFLKIKKMKRMNDEIEECLCSEFEKKEKEKKSCREGESSPWPHDLQSCALPTELSQQSI